MFPYALHLIRCYEKHLKDYFKLSYNRLQKNVDYREFYFLNFYQFSVDFIDVLYMTITQNK